MDKEKRRNILLDCLIILLALAVIGLFVGNKIKQNQEAAELARLQAEETARLQAEAQARRELEEKDGFYEKLADGLDVNVLLLGDSIATPDGLEDETLFWGNQLALEMNMQYEGYTSLTALAQAGSTAAQALERLNALESAGDYDLALLCLGQNDDAAALAASYEALLQGLRQKYAKCSVICILPAALGQEKAQVIAGLAQRYHAQVVDMAAASTPEALAPDGVHPSAAGHALYQQAEGHYMKRIEAYEDLRCLNFSKNATDKFLNEHGNLSFLSGQPCS